MTNVHATLAQSLMLYFGLVGVWGVVQGLLRRPVGPSYRGALFIAEVIAVAQVLIGVVLLLQGMAPQDDLHYLYGGSLVVTLPLAHQYLAGRLPPALAYGLGCLFMLGLTIRSMTTGQ